MKFGKKNIKLSIVALVIITLVVGLSVGLTQKNKSNSAAAASNDNQNIDLDSEYDNECLDKSVSGKSGKSGDRKSEGKSGKSGENSCRLVVPGTEEYVNVVGMGKRRKLRNKLMRGKSLWQFWILDCFCSWYLTKISLSFNVQYRTGNHR